MKSYLVGLCNGNQTIVEAKSLEAAQKWALETFGTILMPRVAEAKQEDIDWTKAFGGRIHVDEE